MTVGHAARAKVAVAAIFGVAVAASLGAAFVNDRSKPGLNIVPEKNIAAAFSVPSSTDTTCGNRQIASIVAGTIDMSKLNSDRGRPRTPEGAVEDRRNAASSEIRGRSDISFQGDEDGFEHRQDVARYVGRESSGRVLAVYELVRGESGAWAVTTSLTCLDIPVGAKVDPSFQKAPPGHKPGED